MSLYTCLDRMNAALDENANATDSITDESEKQFIKQIIDELNVTLQQTQEGQGGMLILTREKIIAYLKVKHSKATEDLLKFVEFDIKYILNQMGLVPIKTNTGRSVVSTDDSGNIVWVPETTDYPKPPVPAIQKLIRSRFCIQYIQQGLSIPIGSSRGECYGIAKVMIDPSQSPYHGKPFVYNRTVYNYQKDQYDRRNDQNGVLRQRLTREYFCPLVSEQAKRLYQHASQHIGQDFMVVLRKNRFAHACYFSQQIDGKMRYMDPNHGAFLFDTQEQFVAAYQLLYADVRYQLYQISRLTLNPFKAPENHSIQGKVRSLLTGGKYLTKMIYWMHHILNAAVGLGVGGALGAIVGTFIFPMIGTLIGAGIGGLIGGLAAYKASRASDLRGHHGLLGPYHLLRQEYFEYHDMKGRPPIQQLQEILGLNTEIAPQSSSYTTMSDRGLQSAASLGESVEPYHHVVRPAPEAVGAEESKEEELQAPLLRAG